MQDIKWEKITPGQLDDMKKMTGSYKSLFSRRAMKYKELGLKDNKLTEKDYRNFILEEYTFLKRPVVIIEDKIFVGSEKKTVESLKKNAQVTRPRLFFRSLVSTYQATITLNSINIAASRKDTPGN
jgi:arsenate reductase